MRGFFIKYIGIRSKNFEDMPIINMCIKLKSCFSHRMNELSHKYKYLQKDKENAERTINNLSKTVQQRNKEIDSLVETLEK